MKKIALVLFLILVGIGVSLAQYNWVDNVVDRGIKPDIAISLDQIFIAYMHEDNNGFVKCATINSNEELSIKTIANGYFYGPLDIAVDLDGLPRIVYHDHNPGDLAYAVLQNDLWSSKLLTHPGHDGWDASIFIDDDDNSHIVSVDPSNGIEYTIVADSNIITEVVQEISTGYKYATDIISRNGIIHTVYHIESTNELYYAFKKDGVWAQEKIADNAYFPSMSLDSSDEPAVAYYSLTSNQGRIQLARKKQGNWSNTQVIDITDVEITFLGARKIVDLEYSDNRFCIAINNKTKVWYGCLIDDVWDLSTPVDFSNTDTILGQQVSMAIGTDGSPHLSYFVRDNAIGEGGVVHYLRGVKRFDSTLTDIIHLVSKTGSNEKIPNVSYELINDNGEMLVKVESEELNIKDIPIGVTQICPTKSDNPARDLSALDIVRSQRLVLGLSEHCKEDFIAGDVNKSGQVSASDLILTVNVILGKSANFPKDESWRFYRENTDIENMSLQEIYESGCYELNEVRNNPTDLEFIGVKLGDIKCEKQ